MNIFFVRVGESHRDDNYEYRDENLNPLEASGFIFTFIRGHVREQDKDDKTDKEREGEKSGLQIK